MDSNTVLQYGSAAQKKVTDFSNSALKNVRTKDLGEIGNILTDLVVNLKTHQILMKRRDSLQAYLIKVSQRLKNSELAMTRQRLTLKRLQVS